MKLLCFSAEGQSRLGLKLDDGVLDLTAAGYPRDLKDTIKNFEAAKKEIDKICLGGTLPLLKEDSLSYLPPASSLSKILCVGQNYKEHVEEMHKSLAMTYPPEPVLFSKFNNALTGHRSPVKLSANAHCYDYEAELVIVIGKGGMDIPKEKAADYIFGYTCGNDLSAREAQKKTSQWLIGKSLPGFAPAGPWIVTADELDPCHLDISCRRGEELVQNSNTSRMIFDIYTIVSYASKFILLEPGDLIFTGTPAGVIFGKEADQQNWLTAGEEVTVTIQHIGSLTTKFI